MTDAWTTLIDGLRSGWANRFWNSSFPDKPALGWDKPLWGIMRCRACRYIKEKQLRLCRRRLKIITSCKLFLPEGVKTIT